MTTESSAAPSRVPAIPAARGGTLARDLMSAEWTKIRSVRSTVWTVTLFVVISLGLTALFTWLTVANWNGPRAADRDARVLIDPVGFILGSGLFLGQLTICVLGVLVITSEYSTGTIRASLLAVPRRLEMLTAKTVVFAVLLIVVAEIVAFGSFFIGSAILHSRVPVSLGDRNVTRAVVGTGLYLTVLGLFSLAIGSLIRHTAGAISAAIGAVLVLPILAGQLGRARQRLPARAGRDPDRPAAPSGRRQRALRLAGVRGLLPLDRGAARRERLPAAPPRRLGRRAHVARGRRETLGRRGRRGRRKAGVHVEYPLVGPADIGPVGRLADRLRAQPLDHRGLVEQQLLVLGRGRSFHDLRERVELPDQHRGHAAAGLADLLERALDQALVGDLGRDQPNRARGVAVDAGGLPPARHLVQAVPDPVNAGQGGERVVDGRGERTDADLDQLVEAERDVLGQGPVRPGHMGPGQLARDLIGGAGRPHGRVGVALDQEVAGPVAEVDHRLLLGGDPDKSPVLDVLQV